MMGAFGRWTSWSALVGSGAWTAEACGKIGVALQWSWEGVNIPGAESGYILGFSCATCAIEAQARYAIHIALNMVTESPHTTAPFREVSDRTNATLVKEIRRAKKSLQTNTSGGKANTRKSPHGLHKMNVSVNLFGEA